MYRGYRPRNIGEKIAFQRERSSHHYFLFIYQVLFSFVYVEEGRYRGEKRYSIKSRLDLNQKTHYQRHESPNRQPQHAGLHRGADHTLHRRMSKLVDPTGRSKYATRVKIHLDFATHVIHTRKYTKMVKQREMHSIQSFQSLVGNHGFRYSKKKGKNNVKQLEQELTARSDRGCGPITRFSVNSASELGSRDLPHTKRRKFCRSSVEKDSNTFQKSLQGEQK